MERFIASLWSYGAFYAITTFIARVAKEKMGTLLLASEMPVPIPRNRTVKIVDELRPLI
jgi:hypothetical protein